MSPDKLLIIVILIAGFVFRIVGLDILASCMGDQGAHFAAVNQLLSGDVSLVGPPSSVVIEDKVFFFGPYSHWLPAAPMAILGVNYLGYALFMTGLQVMGMWLLWRLPIANTDKHWWLVIWWLNPWLITATRNFWNPSLMLVLVWLSLVLLLVPKLKSSLVSGLLFGMGLTSHYSAIFVGIFAGWMLRKHPRLLVCWLIGVGLAVAPLVLFELRNDWYNSRLIIKAITADGISSSGTGLSWHYLLAGVALLQLLPVGKLPRVALPVVAVLLVLWQSFTPLDRGLDMPPGLTCRDMDQTVLIMSAFSTDRQTNILDMVTGDLRARYLRYRLLETGTTIGSVDDYPDTRELYILVDNDSFDPTSHEPWELSQVQPAEVGMQIDFGRYRLIRLSKIQ